MIQTSILEQLEKVYQIFIKNSNMIYVLVIAGVAFLILELANCLKNKKVTKIISFIIYVGILGTLFYFFHSEILKFLDYFMNNLILFLFFPNLAVYTLVILIINILLITSILSKRKKVEKHLNVLFFVLFQILFYLIIDNVITNNVNIYQQLSIYTNSNLLTLIQISMYLFLLWLGILFILKIASKLVESLFLKNEEIKEKVIDKESDFVEITPNTLKIATENNLDIIPVKKNFKSDLNSMEELFENTNKDMEIVFGKQNSMESILFDIEKLKENKNDKDKLKKIYDEISLNSKDLTLNDYNSLITALREIKNNN